MKKQLFLAFVLFGFIACGNSSPGGFADMSSRSKAEFTGEMEEFDEAKMQEEQMPERKIIKTADLRMQVEDVGGSTEKVKGLVQGYNGRITRLDQTNSSYEINNHFVIRVPSETFEKLVEDIAQEAMFINYNRVYSTDVTEEYLDVETRLKTKKEVRDKYIEILRNKAKTVEEILKAEEAIRVIQEEIEAKEGRLKYLQNQVGMSTINLDLYQKVEYQARPDVYRKPFGKKVTEGLANGWDLIVDTLIFFINVWPFTILLILLLWKGGWLWRKLRRQ